MLCQAGLFAGKRRKHGRAGDAAASGDGNGKCVQPEKGSGDAEGRGGGDETAAADVFHAGSCNGDGRRTGVPYAGVIHAQE